jgi:hypothetical protein
METRDCSFPIATSTISFCSGKPVCNVEREREIDKNVRRDKYCTPILMRVILKRCNLIGLVFRPLRLHHWNSPRSKRGLVLTSKRSVCWWYHLMAGGGLPTASQSISSEAPTGTLMTVSFLIVTLTHSLGRTYFGPARVREKAWNSSRSMKKPANKIFQKNLFANRL